MKKRILLLAVMVVSLCLMLAIGVSAAAGDYFGDVEIIDNDEDGISDIDITTRIPTVKEKAEGVHGSDEARVTVTCTCAAGKHTFPTYYISSKQDGTTLYRLDFTALNAVLGEYCGNTAGLSIANITAYEAPNGYDGSWAGLFHENGTGTFRGTSIKYISFAKQDTLKKLSSASSGKNWVSSSPIEEIDFGTLQNVPSWFAESCKSLVSVTIPDTVLTIDGQAFRNCSNLTTVNISKNSKLTGFAVEAFGNCSSLVALYLPDSLTTLNIGGGNVGPFNKCSNLYFVNEPGTTEKPSIYYFPENLSDVSGEAIKNCGALNSVLVFGEKVKSLNNGWAFQGSQTIVVFLGDMEAITTSNWAVTKIYFANANDKSKDNIATYSNSKTAVFCASETDTSKHMVSPKHSSVTPATCYSNKTEVNKCFCGKTLSEGEVENTMLDHVYKTSNSCIVGAQCENFEHCGAELSPIAQEHAMSQTVIYAQGFTKSGVHSKFCTNENCTVEDKDIVLSPIFVAKGYSTNSEKTAINGGYTVNLDALEIYEGVNGNITYGIVIANAEKFDGKSFFNESNKVNTTKALQVEINNEYSNFNCSIEFGTITNNSLKLIICAYVIEGDNVTFIQADSGEAVDSTLVTGGSFKSVTLPYVVALVPAESKEN